MKCECGNNEFYSYALVTVTYDLKVVTNEHGDYLDDAEAPPEFVGQDAFLDEEMDVPKGPYICTECGKQYNQLTEEN